MPKTEQLYIELLKKIITNRIYQDKPVSPWSGGEYRDADRIGGRDWPSKAMTMIGEKRLDNIKQCIDTILANDVPGDFAETGVWRGGACIFMRGILKVYDVHTRTIWAADSFEGLPHPDPVHEADVGDAHHTHEILSVSLEEVEENFRRVDLLDGNTIFLKGWFKDTLPEAPIDKLALLRLDGDMYSSTMDALNALYHKVSSGGFVIVDDYGSTPNCRAAVDEFRSSRGVNAQIHNIDGLGVYWQIQ